MRRTTFFSLVLILPFFFAAAARAQDPAAACARSGYLANFDSRIEDQPCASMTGADIHWNGGTARINVIRRRRIPYSGDPAVAARINELAADVGNALNLLGGSFSAFNGTTVTILMTGYVSAPVNDGDWEHKGDTMAMTWSDSGNECPVAYYKAANRTSGNEFIFTLAHEIFHCVQYRVWRSWPHNRDWVTEASAEYFAYLAVPAGTRLRTFIDGFDSDIRTEPLDQLSYSAVVYYLWLGNTRQPSGVRQFLDTVTTPADSITPDQWVQFAQAYYDQAIHLPSGAQLVNHPAVGRDFNITGSFHSEGLNPAPFTLHSSAFVFARGKIYHLTYGTSPADYRMKWNEGASTGSWTDPLQEVMACDSEKRYRILWTSTRSNQSGSIDVRAEDAQPGACTCPAGTWQETAASLQHYFQQSALGIYSGGAVTELLSGSRTLVLNPDHTGSFTYNSIATRTTSRDSTLTSTKNGGTHFTWKTVNGQLLTVYTPGDNLLHQHNESVIHGHTSITDVRIGAQSIGHFYRCDAQGLHLTVPTQSRSPLQQMYGSTFSADMDFTRVGAPPPALHP